MTSEGIHWHEGLFLQPQHLQHLQRQGEAALQQERAWLLPYPYGVVKRVVNQEALANWRLEFEVLTVVMPSGRVVSWPENAILPTIDLRPLFGQQVEELQIVLAVPLWFPRRRNALLPHETAETQRVLFQPEEKDIYDENTGDNPKAVAVRKINATLLVEGEDTANTETLPIIRLKRDLSEENAVPKPDTNFIPPTMLVGGSPLLVEMLQQFSAVVEKHRESLTLQMKRAGFRIQELRNTQLESLLRLQILNKMHARLPELRHQAASLPTVLIFRYLQEMLVEMAALYPDRDDEFAVLPYDHDDPGPNFRLLFSRLFDLVEGEALSNFIRLTFRKSDFGWLTELEPKHFTQPTDFYLGVRAKEDQAKLSQLIEDRDQFKLMARSLAERAIFGIKLNQVSVPPMQLPAQAGLYYYRLDLSASERMWEQIKQEQQMVARWPNWETTEYELALYMTLPN